MSPPPASSRSRRAIGLRHGIEAERSACQRRILIPVAEVASLEEGLVEIRFPPERPRTDSGHPVSVGHELEGATAYGGGGFPATEPVWRGRILVADGATGRITLRLRTGSRPPRPGDTLHVDPYPFLAHLHRWSREIEAIPEAYARATTPGQVAAFATETFPPLPLLAGLRPSQGRAVAACRRRLALIWGPPGTGKTFTLGAAIAGHLAAGRRVLALSTTNVAVDLLTLAIDDAWRTLGHPPAEGEIIRAGRPHHPALLQDEKRRHLLRWTTFLDEIHGELARLHRRREALARALQDDTLPADHRGELSREEAAVVEAIRALEVERSATLSHLTAEARCVATTFTSYLANRTIQEQPFAVTAVDEASMVSAAAACRLLGDHRDGWIFAGDFQQLPPVCQAANRSTDAAHWMGQSLFDHLTLGSRATRSRLRRAGVLVALQEQSRMVAPLCQVVSATFYDGILTTVAPPGPARFGEGWPGGAIVVIDPAGSLSGSATTPRPQKSGRGYTWDRSAQLIRLLVQRLLAAPAAPSAIAAITPYRNQAQLLDNVVGVLDPERIRAGTIHRMQGSEADVVFLDPVRPADWFPSRSPDSARLMNVATSRARRQLLLVGRPDDLAGNPHLAPFVARAEVWVPDREWLDGLK